MPHSDIGEDDVGNGAKKGWGGEGIVDQRERQSERERRPKRKRKMTCCEGETGGVGGKRGRRWQRVACGTPGRQRVWQREQTGAAASPVPDGACVGATRTRTRTRGTDNPHAYVTYVCAADTPMRRPTDRPIVRRPDDAAKHLSHEVTMSQDHPRCYFSPLLAELIARACSFPFAKSIHANLSPRSARIRPRLRNSLSIRGRRKEGKGSAR